MTPNRGPVTFEELLGLLVRDGLLAQDRAQELYEHKDRQLARLVQEQQRALASAGPASSSGPRSAEAVVVGPIELLLSFGATDPRGRALSEDKVTELYARALGLPYVKLDPLKLDAAFVTGAWSRAFARKHTMLAIADQGTAVRVALLDPFDRWGLENAERSVGR
ncbi:MAG: hypothetical protein FJ096_17630, partial [Deltaproteobacteria bacterium]|nr:hypothetical protein [Deltaproteobacteria bacterium]